jgi:diguanylate cyclase
MGQHEASFNPTTFAIWYEFAAGSNYRLTEAVSRQLAAMEPFNDSTIGRLYDEFIAAPSPSEIESANVALQRALGRILVEASRTGQRADSFGAELAELAATLENNDPVALLAMVRRAAVSTADMTSSAQTLEREAADSRREIESLREQLTRARSEALIDPLTGLLNRRGLGLRLSALSSEANQPQPSHCLIMIDIDHFKHVNDRHGHVMGDQVIQALAHVLKSAALGEQAAARYGGEEFALLVPNTGVDDSMKLAASLRKRTKEYNVTDPVKGGRPISVTISLGVTAWRVGDDPASFVARADGALYVAKQAGRDRVSFA